MTTDPRERPLQALLDRLENAIRSEGATAKAEATKLFDELKSRDLVARLRECLDLVDKRRSRPRPFGPLITSDLQGEELAAYRRCSEALFVGIAGAVSNGDGQGFYIQDTRSVVGNSAVWWRPDGKGYTGNLNEAGVYHEPPRCRETDVPVPVATARCLAELHVDVSVLRAELEVDCV